jgi:membrane protein
MQSRAPAQWTGDATVDWLVEHTWIPAPVIVVPLAVIRFFQHYCVQWAAALAYYTLIGLVPLLAALFSVMKVAGFHREITPYVVNTIGAGSPVIAAHIVDFIDKTNVRAVGVLSVIAACLAVLAIMGNAEICFNAIWGGVRGRSVPRKLRSYGKVMIVAPLLLLIALALTAFLQPGTRLHNFLDSWSMGDPALVLLRVLPYALLWLSFTLLYTGLPNTAVRPTSAIVGALVAGTIWQAAQWTYVTFVIRLVRYSAVYGALWQLPILLAWIYIAWGVILFGAEVSRAQQDVTDRRLALRQAEDAIRAHEPPEAAIRNPEPPPPSVRA